MSTEHAACVISNEIAISNIAPTGSSMKPEEESDKFKEYHLKFAKFFELMISSSQVKVFYNSHVVAHSCMPIPKLAMSSEVKFTPHVANALQDMLGESKPYDMQTLAWNHLLANNSLILISEAGSGRTLCYLPAICTLVEQNSKLGAHGTGPIALVLVLSTLHARKVYQDARKLLQSDCTIVAAHADVDNTEVCAQLEAGCSMLVATLPQLELLLVQHQIEKKLFCGNRLFHIVIDDVDMMSAFNPLKLAKMLVKLFKLGKKLPMDHKLRQQVVVTSKSLERFLTPKLLRKIKQPLLLFGDFLEAILYGCYTLEVKVTAHGLTKLKTLIDTIKLFSPQQRSVIVCKNINDVLTVQVAVHSAGFVCIPCLRDWDSLMQAEIEIWCKLPTPPLLICTDEQIKWLQVYNAHNLIHYSLPNCWPKFKQRHSLLVASYHNWIATQCAKVINHRLHVLVLFEYESIDEELPLLVEFLINHKVCMDPKLLVLAKHFQQQIENTVNKSSSIDDFTSFTSSENVNNPSLELGLELSNDSDSDNDCSNNTESASSDPE